MTDILIGISLLVCVVAIALLKNDAKERYSEYFEEW